MNYNWDIEKIKLHKKKLYQLLFNDKMITKEEREAIKQNIRDLNYIQSNVLGKDNKKLDFFAWMNYIDSEKIITTQNLYYYLDIPTKIKNLILYCIPCLQGFSYNEKLDNIPKQSISNEKLISLSHDFFKSLPNKSLIKDVQRFTNPNKNLLNISNHQNFSEFGYILPFYYPRYTPYFNIFKTHSINDIYSLNHELAHGIYYKKPISNTPTNRNYQYLTELEGDFFEILTTDFLKNRIDSTILEKIDYQNLTVKINAICFFFIISIAIKQYYKKGDIHFEDIVKQFIESNLTIYLESVEDLKKGFAYTPQHYAIYSLSYLISLDLENILQTDPELAFYSFEKIRNNRTQNIYDNLKQNKISFMDDDYQNLRNKIKKFKK